MALGRGGPACSFITRTQIGSYGQLELAQCALGGARLRAGGRARPPPTSETVPTAGAVARAGVGGAAPGVDHRRNLRIAHRPRAGFVHGARRRRHRAAACGNRRAPRRTRSARDAAPGRRRRRTGGVGRRHGRPHRDRGRHRACLPHGGDGAATPHPRPVAVGGRGRDVRGGHHAAAGRARLPRDRSAGRRPDQLSRPALHRCPPGRHNHRLPRPVPGGAAGCLAGRSASPGLGRRGPHRTRNRL